MRNVRRQAALLLMMLVPSLGVAACSDADVDGGAVTVVATTTILGDLAANIVGEDATVQVLIPLGADPHDYRPSSRDVAAIQSADLVVANGLGLEEGLGDVLDSAAADGARVLEVAPRLDPIPFGESGDGSDSADGDPHVWFDPLRMADAAGLIAGELAAVDTSVDWRARADIYATALRAADGEIAGILSAIPESRRKLVTNHDALGYFAARYGFEVIGTVIPGGATLAEPSSAELAALVEEIEAAGVRAIFAETTEPSTLAEAIAAEIGDSIEVIDLYTGSLGEPGSGADTYIGMLLTDARRIADALA